MAKMLEIYHRYQPKGQIACTRKNIPNTKLLATQAVLAGGGIIHRQGCSETILLFANHRHFYPSQIIWLQQVTQLRQTAPEKCIVVKQITQINREALKRSQISYNWINFLEDITLQTRGSQIAPRCHLLSLGNNLNTIEKYAQTGIGFNGDIRPLLRTT